MKRITTIATALCLAITSQAQIVGSFQDGYNVKPTIEKPKEPSTTINYIRLGLNISGAHGDGAKNSKSVLLYDLVWGFQRPIVSEFYWGMEFGLSARGFKFEDKGSYSGSSYKYTEKLTAHQLRLVPIQLGYRFNIGDKVKIDPHVGVFFSGDFAGSYKEELTYSGDKDSESTSIYDINDYRYFQVGGQFGVGVWFSKFNLDFSYQFGGLDYIKDSKMKSHNFLIRLGFAL